MSPEIQGLMRSALSQMQHSARAYHRIQKPARTIADLAACEEIWPVHLAEALHHRPKIMMVQPKATQSYPVASTSLP